MKVVLRLAITAAALWLTTLWIPGIEVTRASSAGEQVLIVLVVAAVLVAVNAVIRPVVAFLTTPLYVLTLGLFSLVVNALMLLLTGWITGFTRWGLMVDGFWTAVLGGLVLSVITWVLSLLVPGARRRRVRRTDGRHRRRTW